MTSLEAAVWSGAVSEKGARGWVARETKDTIITQRHEFGLFSLAWGRVQEELRSI